MKRTLLAMSISVIALFSACRKESGELVIELPDEMPIDLATKITNADGSTVEKFYYDNDRRLIAKTFRSSTRRDSDVVTYDASGKVVKYDEYYFNRLDESTAYSYNGNLVTREQTSYSNDGSAYSSTSTFTINSKNQLVEKLRDNGSKYTYEYDPSGNMIKTFRTETDGVKTELSSFTFDNTNTMMTHCTTPYWWFIVEDYFPMGSKNNIVSVEGGTKLYEYVYNLHLYPEKVTEISVRDGQKVPGRTHLIEYKNLNW
ncbi:hypothetical protein [Arcticibacter sp. MXS-1]|uniref:hypothetical protein n=1 Tax=Arcticibacter sp. MXS-1 TaxID=3341726 RepID=UPI0035A9838E